MNQLITSDIKMTSLDIAKVTGKKHAHIMRDIRNEVEDLGEEIAQSIFGLGSYLDRNNQERPCYEFGKDGAMQLALKYDAKTRYNVIQYVEKLERQPRLLSDKEQLIASMKLSIETAEELNGIKDDVNYLKGNMRIDSLQQKDLQQSAKRTIVKALGGKKSNAYQEMSRKVFPAFWNEFKEHFGIPRYPDLPKIKFDDAINFIKMWRPSTTLQIKIDNFNQQMKLSEKELV